MKKIFYLFAATVVLAAVGCSKDDAAQEEVKYVSEIKIGFEGDTRVTAEQIASGLKFSFEDGEEIEVYAVDNIGVTMPYEYDATTQTLKATNESYKLQEGKKYFAITKTLSSDAVKVDTEGNVTAETKLNTTSGIKDMPMITDVFTASADGTVATMHHLVGVVEVPVKLDPESPYDVLYQLSLSRVSGLSGVFTAIPKAPYIKVVTTPYNSTVSDVRDVKLSKESATSVFIPVLPGTYTDAITLNRFYYSGENKSSGSGTLGGSAPKTLVVERGKITKVTEHTIGLW
ncbi:MAG: hypothetical protein E7127_02005 [Rikenellaceae bacterium]|nr:hypothetical protein [Rikenellaceae bacterium]